VSAAAVRRLRLACGLVLLAWLLTHFGNHALGLVSLEAMERGRIWALLLWRNPLGTAALYGALLTHALLGLWRLWERRTLRMPAWEATQLTLGLAIPPFLAAHVVGNRVAHEWFGVNDTYARILHLYWVQAPELGVTQMAVLLAAWAHGCVGLHYWLRFRPWYPRAAVLLLAAATLVPVLALLGVAQGGREVIARAETPGWGEALARITRTPDAAARAAITAAGRGVARGYLVLLGAVLFARAARGAYLRRYASVRVGYPEGRVATVPRGLTVLEASRMAGIPHASVCGGRGRCSTCRVRVTRGLDALPPPREAEARVLARIGAAPDVRLACQIRPVRDVAVIALLPAGVGPAAAHAPDARRGREREIAVLFADLRGFARAAEHKLPYDVVWILNRYFEVVGTAVTGAGGVANQFTGDGAMALFGVERGPEAGCRDALAAARAIVEGVAALSRELAGELAAPLAIGVGIHAGPAVVGQMGWGAGMYLTAVGDTVHVAARLEQATKDHAAELVVSEEVARYAAVDLGRFPRADLSVRNRTAPVAARIVARVAELPPA